MVVHFRLSIQRLSTLTFPGVVRKRIHHADLSVRLKKFNEEGQAK
jgi:hypothetical protein